jgi:hypothetical protein
MVCRNQLRLLKVQSGISSSPKYSKIQGTLQKITNKDSQCTKDDVSQVGKRYACLLWGSAWGARGTWCSPPTATGGLGGKPLRQRSFVVRTERAEAEDPRQEVLLECTLDRIRGREFKYSLTFCVCNWCGTSCTECRPSLHV